MSRAPLTRGLSISSAHPFVGHYKQRIFKQLHPFVGFQPSQHLQIKFHEGSCMAHT